MIHCHIKKTKPKKLTKVQQSEYDAWCKSIESMTSGIRVDKRKILKSNITNKMPVFSVPHERSTRHIPSLNPADSTPATKPVETLRYTGDKMIGIGTLHKSNAVPIFNSDAAHDIAKMRR